MKYVSQAYFLALLKPEHLFTVTSLSSSFPSAEFKNKNVASTQV